jgi:hypothetical protein
LDDLVLSNGNRSLADLAQGWLDSRANATVPAAIVAQCCLVRDIFSAAISRPSLGRNCYVMVRNSGDSDRILESRPGRGLVALAIFDLGQLRDSAQLFNMAVERLIMFFTTTGIRY